MEKYNFSKKKDNLGTLFFVCINEENLNKKRTSADNNEIP